MLAELKALANIIQSSVDKIEEAVNTNGLVLPSSNVPFSLDSEAPLMHPSIQSAGSLIISAAGQIVTLVRPAQWVITNAVTEVGQIIPASIAHIANIDLKFHFSSALRTAIITHAAEILRDVGPKVTPYTSVENSPSKHRLYSGFTCK